MECLGEIMKRRQLAAVGALLAGFVATMAHGAAPVVTFRAEVTRSSLGGVGRWDDLSVDAENHRLYLSRSDFVMVVNTLTGDRVGQVPNTQGVHGIALVPEMHVGFTSNGKSDSVTEFDLVTLKPLSEIKVTGKNPDAIVYDPATRSVVTFNGNSANATVIDAATRKVAGSIALPGKPEFARADGHGRMFVNIEDRNEIASIDSRTRTVVAAWPLVGCEEPTGLALDDAHRRLFSVCQNGKMIVTDADSGTHVADVPIGAGPDGAAFDAVRSLVFSPNGRDGTLTVVREDDADHYTVVAIVPTRKSARTIALDEISHRLYMPAAEFEPLPANSPPHARPEMKPDSFMLLSADVLFKGDGGN
jgi:DNA-binding beta-propeller fold protein YncE